MFAVGVGEGGSWDVAVGVGGGWVGWQPGAAPQLADSLHVPGALQFVQEERRGQTPHSPDS